jgi:hypothetical protein
VKTCAICQEPACREIVSFGELPICHHFLADGEVAGTHPAALGQCEFCGLVQMMDPIPPAKLVPRFDWIKYNEPEAHLDLVVDALQKFPGIERASRIGGMSFNDDSTLRRFRERGFANTWRADMVADLDIRTPNAGIETVQSKITPTMAAGLRRKYGPPDLLIVRMMLEHTGAAAVFLKAIAELVGDSGRVMFEVPDCGRAFDLFDYTTLWEDHTLYFVERTFLAALGNSGFRVEWFECYRGPYENCLVALASPTTAQGRAPLRELDKESELQRATKFAYGFKHRQRILRAELEKWRRRGKIALFGAGHQSVMFLNLMGISDLVECVLDDHPSKCGRKMPGSQLPIVASSTLCAQDIVLCLSSLGAASEPKVLKKHEEFISKGGVFASIFPVDQDRVFNVLAGITADQPLSTAFT